MRWTPEQLREYELRNAPRIRQGESPDAAAQAESDLHYSIISECKKRAWIYFHGSMAHATRRSIGEPDFTILANRGRVFFIECKARNGKLSPAQSGVVLHADTLGHKIHVISSMTQFFEIVEP